MTSYPRTLNRQPPSSPPQAVARNLATVDAQTLAHDLQRQYLKSLDDRFDTLDEKYAKVAEQQAQTAIILERLANRLDKLEQEPKDRRRAITFVSQNFYAIVAGVVIIWSIVSPHINLGWR